MDYWSWKWCCNSLSFLQSNNALSTTTFPSAASIFKDRGPSIGLKASRAEERTLFFVNPFRTSGSSILKNSNCFWATSGSRLTLAKIFTTEFGASFKPIRTSRGISLGQWTVRRPLERISKTGSEKLRTRMRLSQPDFSHQYLTLLRDISSFHTIILFVSNPKVNLELIVLEVGFIGTISTVATSTTISSSPTRIKLL